MSRAEAAEPPSGGREARLWRAVASLADRPPSADEARKRPSTEGFAENLVFEFDEAYTTFVEGFEELPSEAQLVALQAVDTKVSSMVRATDGALWTELARREDPSWVELRALTQWVLDVFHWPGGGPS
jgi:hypothetical protein